MKQMIDVKVKDQFSQVYNAQAMVRGKDADDSRAIFHRIEHIVVAGEIILPSIELLKKTHIVVSFFMPKI